MKKGALPKNKTTRQDLNEKYHKDLNNYKKIN